MATMPSAEPSYKVRGTGSAAFAAILLVVAGTLNIIYGIGAIADSAFFVNETRYVFADLHTWGWITLIVGLVQLTGGFSLGAGNAYGRVIGVTAASIGAVVALLSVGGATPFWSVGIFALCVIVIHGLLVYGQPDTR
jgi:hypothetical protein